MVGQVQARHEATLRLRNQDIHGIWANGDADKIDPVGYDIRRGEILSTHRFDDDLKRVSALTHERHACLMRVGELIVENKLPEEWPTR